MRETVQLRVAALRSSERSSESNRVAGGKRREYLAQSDSGASMHATGAMMCREQLKPAHTGFTEQRAITSFRHHSCDR